MEEQHRKRRLTSPIPGALAAGSPQKKVLLSAGSDAAAPGDSKAAAVKADADESEATSLDQRLGLEDGFLESFRREALARQLSEYRRMLASAQAAADKLQADWKQSETRLIYTEQCWSQLQEELAAVLGEAEAPPPASVNGHAHPESMEEDSDQRAQPEIDPTLMERVELTKRYLSLVSQRAASTPGKDIVSRYEALAGQLIESRSSHKLLQALLARTQEELDSTRSALLSLERKAERDKSQTIQKLYKRSEPPAAADGTKKSTSSLAARSSASNAPSPAAGAVAGGAVESAAVKREDDRSLESPAAQVVKQEPEEDDEDDDDKQEGSSGLTRAEVAELRLKAELREKEAEELREQKLALMHEMDTLKMKFSYIPEDQIRQHPTYKALEASFDQIKQRSALTEASLSSIQTEANELREKQVHVKSALEKESQDTNNELHSKNRQLQQDIMRIRTERDMRTAEVQDLKAKEADRGRALEQLKVLSESKQKRITALVSEILRYKMTLAAKAGNADLVQDLMKQAASLPEASEETLPEEGVLANLQQKLKEQEELVATFRKRLEVISGASQEDIDMAEMLVRNEAVAMQEAAQAKATLAKLQGLLDATGAAADKQKVSAKIEADEKRIENLEASLKASEMSMQMLITEVTRLSEAWESLNAQNQSKVLGLAVYEAKLERAALEKSRTTQKYYAVERDRETLTNSNAIYVQVHSSQKAAIEILNEEIRLLKAKLDTAEKEISNHQEKERMREEKLLSLVTEKKSIEARANSLDKQVFDSRNLLRERTSQIETEAAARRKLEGDLTRLRRDVDKWKLRATAATASANSKGGLFDTSKDEYVQNLQSMLWCSSCASKPKSHTITRCFHMFCKGCIDARLETRQRKCPSCSIPFGAADVQQLYFQSG